MADTHYLEREFSRAKHDALAFIERHNDKLPAQRCPSCHAEGHVPGLPCPEATCGYRHDVSWAILLDTEWGYDVVSLNDRKHVVISYNVEAVA